MDELIEKCKLYQPSMVKQLSPNWKANLHSKNMKIIERSIHWLNSAARTARKERPRLGPHRAAIPARGARRRVGWSEVAWNRTSWQVKEVISALRVDWWKEGIVRINTWGRFQRAEMREGRGTGYVPEMRETGEEKAVSLAPHLWENTQNSVEEEK